MEKIFDWIYGFASVVPHFNYKSFACSLFFFRDIFATSPPLSYKIKDEETSASAVKALWADFWTVKPCILCRGATWASWLAKVITKSKTTVLNREFLLPLFWFKQIGIKQFYLQLHSLYIKLHFQLVSAQIYSYYMHLVK